MLKIVISPRDYSLTYEYITESGDVRTESELVKSYPGAFEALNRWLFYNQKNGYQLISARIKEI